MGKINFSSWVLALGTATVFAGCDVGTSTGPNNGSPDASSNVDSPISATPKLDISVDKTAVDTELLSTQTLVITAKGSDGFSGLVTLTATVVDGADAPIANYTATFSSPTLTLTTNGTSTAMLTVSVPNKMPAAAAKIKISAASSATLGTKAVASTLTVANQVTLKVEDNGTECKYPTAAMANREVLIGTKVRWMNAGASAMTIHIDSGIPGVVHEPGSHAAGAVYEQTPGTVGTIGWYCHVRGPTVNTLNINVVAP
jgi:plastocyanin